MAILTNIDNYRKNAFERACDALNHNLGSGNSNLKTTLERIDALIDVCERNGFCRFDDIHNQVPEVEAPKKKAKKKPDYVPVDDVEDNTPEAQEQEAQNVFAKAIKDDPNG